MISLFYLVTLLVGISLIAYAFTKKKSDLKSRNRLAIGGLAILAAPVVLITIFTILLIVVVVVFIALFIYTAVFNPQNLGEFIHGDKADTYSLKLKNSKKCDNSSAEIKTYSYSYLNDDLFEERELTLYEDEKNVILLQGGLSSFGEDSSNLSRFVYKNDFLKVHEKKSLIDSFSLNSKILEKYKYTVINQETFDEQSQEQKGLGKTTSTDRFAGDGLYKAPNQIKAVYINPKLVEKADFEKISQCTKQHQVGNLLVYASLKNRLQVIPNTDETYRYSRPIHDQLTCSSNYNLVVEQNGAVKGGVFETTDLGTMFKESLYLGYFDESGNFIRETEIDTNFTYKNPDDERFTKRLIEVGFNTSFNEAETLKLVFDEDGKPINYLIESCQSGNGKTLKTLLE